MKLNIKLKNKNYCKGCPCIYYDEDGRFNCTMKYLNPTFGDYIDRVGVGLSAVRSKKCIKKNGE